jgi:hypothetical protein
MDERQSNGEFAPGNKIWELRSKHGRDKLFASPQLLWEAVCEYFQWATDNKLNGIDRPFTMQRLRLYIGCSSGYFTNFKHGLKRTLEQEFTSQMTEDEKVNLETKQKEATDFLSIIDQIEETVYAQKFEGAIVGMYSTTIIARDLGLRENIDQQVTGNIHLSKEPIVFE